MVHWAASEKLLIAYHFLTRVSIEKTIKTSHFMKAREVFMNTCSDISKEKVEKISNPIFKGECTSKMSRIDEEILVKFYTRLTLSVFVSNF